MTDILFWPLLIAASLGFVWSLFQPDPFIEKVEMLIKKIESEASHGE